jgi:hypothetical protein
MKLRILKSYQGSFLRPKLIKIEMKGAITTTINENPEDHEGIF